MKTMSNTLNNDNRNQYNIKQNSHLYLYKYSIFFSSIIKVNIKSCIIT